MLRPWVVVRERYEGIFGSPDNFISKTNEETRLYTPIRADSMQLCCTCEKAAAKTAPDRKSGVSGKSVYVRVDLGGCGIIKKKKRVIHYRRQQIMKKHHK